jgi:hypothetical protein
MPHILTKYDIPKIHSWNVTSIFFFLGMGWDRVRLHVGHYFAYCTSSRWWMIMSVEQSVEWMTGETEVLAENVSQFVNLKSHITWTETAKVERQRLTAWPRQSQSHSHFTADSQSVSQYVLVSSPICERLTTYVFLPFQVFGSGIYCPVSVGRPLWRDTGSVLCKSQYSHLSVCTFTIYIFVFHTFTICIYIYALYNTYNIYKASFSLGSVEHVMPYHSLVTAATRAV